MRTWLLVAAERREFDGIRRSFAAGGGTVEALTWPGAAFAGAMMYRGDRWQMVANGPGPELVKAMLADAELAKNMNLAGIISTGLCGALDPALKAGDVVVQGDRLPASLPAGRPCVRGQIYSLDRVVVTAAEKMDLHKNSGAVAVDMESAAVAAKAAEWGVPFAAIRAVSDSSDASLVLDFNKFRDEAGRFSRTGVALAAIRHPFSVMPALRAFDRDCRRAANVLGDFLADCRF